MMLTPTATTIHALLASKHTWGQVLGPIVMGCGIVIVGGL